MAWMTTPHTSTDWPSRGTMSGKQGLAALSFMRPARIQSDLQTNSPSTTAMTTCPLLGRMARSTTRASPSNIPASRIESPLARMRKVACGCLMSLAVRSMRFAPRSSAGDGKPARTHAASSTMPIGRLETGMGAIPLTSVTLDIFTVLFYRRFHLLRRIVPMGKPALRIVFDTNAFMPANFDSLAASPFVSLCQSGRIEPIYGHVFLEETFKAYGSEKKRADLVGKWIPMITATAGSFRRDFLEIWHEELVEGRGLKTNPKMRARDHRSLLACLPNIPLDGSWHAFKASREAQAVEDAKRDAQRALSLEIRQEVADWRAATGYKVATHGAPSWPRHLASELDHAGRAFIHSQVACANPSAVANRWSRDKASYPFFTSFARNMLYIGFCAAIRPSMKVDLNAQADLDLMTHLLHAEVLVSNETGFLKAAFDELWRPKGKTLLNSSQFVELISKL